MSFHLSEFSLPKLSALCAFFICFAVVFGAGGWLAPVPQQVSRSTSTAVVLATPTAEPRLEENTPNPSRFVAEMMAIFQQMGMTFTPPSTPDQGSGDSSVPQQQAMFVGIWVPDASSCSLQNFKDGMLPTVINVDGALAGDTYCSFRNPRQVQAGWQVDALCSNKQEQWSTRVHLSMSGDRLVWKSKRGSQAYTRCTSDLRTAQIR